MTKMHRSETAQDAALKQAATIQSMIDDLERNIQILNVNIFAEEERVRMFDRSDPTYPILARTLTARRDNLKLTIAFLAQHLHAITMAVPTAEAA
jgi:hypothetical protein